MTKTCAAGGSAAWAVRKNRMTPHVFVMSSRSPVRSLQALVFRAAEAAADRVDRKGLAELQAETKVLKDPEEAVKGRRVHKEGLAIKALKA